MREIIDLLKKEKSDATSSENSHRNMLVNAAAAFYQAGHEKAAQRVYNELKTLYPRPEFEVSLVQFIRTRVKEMFSSVTIHDATQMIQGMLVESYLRYALRDDDEAFGREKMAEQIYNVYQKEWIGEKVKRVDLPELSMMRFLALDSFLQDQMYPVSLRQGLLDRIKIERPEVYKQFEKIAIKLAEQARQADANQPQN
jgi:hypothetical protein